jgi:hypothetical protein
MCTRLPNSLCSPDGSVQCVYHVAGHHMYLQEECQLVCVCVCVSPPERGEKKEPPFYRPSSDPEDAGSLLASMDVSPPQVES